MVIARIENHTKLMSREVLYRSNHTVISYDERGFFYLRGMGYLSSRQWEEGALAFLEKLGEKNCLNVIVDQSRLKGTWQTLLLSIL